MNVGIQILIGTAIGLIFGFLTLAATINKKENELKTVWKALAETLNDRYRTLRQILSLMSEYMNENKDEISELSETCSKAIDEMLELDNFKKRLENENNINNKLEILKQNISKYPDLLNSEKYNALIEEITEKENIVGEAIRIYNASVLDFKVLLEAFPFSAVCWILNKNADNYGAFNVMQIEEFDETYIDEDEI